MLVCRRTSIGIFILADGSNFGVRKSCGLSQANAVTLSTVPKANIRLMLRTRSTSLMLQLLNSGTQFTEKHKSVSGTQDRLELDLICFHLLGITE